MAVEQYTNDATTLLDGGIDDSVTSLDVDSAAGFPASAQYRIRIDDELILVTGGAGTTTWTVTRGAEGTTAASHSSGAIVEHVLTAGAIDQMRIDNTGAGTTPPTAAKEGRLFLPNSGSILRDTGSLWTPYGPLYKMTKPPLVSAFTWDNQAGSTATDQESCIDLTTPFIGSTGSLGETLSVLYKAAPSTPYTVTICVSALCTQPTSRLWRVGIVGRQSSDGKLVVWFLGQPNQTALYREIWHMNSTTSRNSSPLVSDDIAFTRSGPIWLRLEDDGVDRNYSLSIDGRRFMEFYSEGRTNFLTVDQVGFGLGYGASSGSGGSVLATIHSYEEG